MTSTSEVTDTTGTTDEIGKESTMSTLHDYLVRAHAEARLREADARRTGDRLVRARRLSRRAERAGRQARLALARLL